MDFDRPVVNLTLTPVYSSSYDFLILAVGLLPILLGCHISSVPGWTDGI